MILEISISASVSLLGIYISLTYWRNMRISKFIFKYRWFIILFWIAAVVAMFVTIKVGNPLENERASFLPDDSEYQISTRKIVEKFPKQYGLSKAMIIFERPPAKNAEGAIAVPAKLTEADKAYIDRIGKAIAKPIKGNPIPYDLKKITVTYPGEIDDQIKTAQKIPQIQLFRKKTNKPKLKDNEQIKNPMRSACSKNGQASIIRVNIPSESITLRATQIIKHIRDVIAENQQYRPAGLKVAITGDAGFGYDYAQFITKSQAGTMWATIIAVVVILLIVYRSPVCSMLPLIAITIAAGVVMKFINVFQNMGCSIGTAEKMFVFVLMYGAGIDYSLLLISRYREFLTAGRKPSDACVDALSATMPAISASAATDAIGILMLVFTQFLIFKTTGPVVAFSLVIAMIASLTLVPALIAVSGSKMFWPVKPKIHSNLEETLQKPTWLNPWPAIAKFVTKRPGITLVLTLAVLAIPAAKTFNIKFTYDALSSINPEYLDKDLNKISPSKDNAVGNAPAGVEMVKRHWPIGEIGPVEVLFTSKKPISPKNWHLLSRMITREIKKADLAVDVRFKNIPLGKQAYSKGIRKHKNNQMILRAAGMQYLGLPIKYKSENASSNGLYKTGYDAMRGEIILKHYAMSNNALDEVPKIKSLCAACIKKYNQSAVAENKVQDKVYMTGATVQTCSIRLVTQGDFKLLLALVLGAIFIIVLLLLKDFWLTLFMVFAIVVSFLTTLGLCHMIFGPGNLDWKVQVFLFVVVAAVGVDYNIFLAARLAQEAKHHQPAEAVRQAVIFTGPVISSCGIIMAATLGSLVVGEIHLLKQLGIALALGMLIDTFVVRPLLLPSFATKFKRTGKANKLLK